MSWVWGWSDSKSFLHDWSPGPLTRWGTWWRMQRLPPILNNYVNEPYNWKSAENRLVGHRLKMMLMRAAGVPKALQQRHRGHGAWGQVHTSGVFVCVSVYREKMRRKQKQEEALSIAAGEMEREHIKQNEAWVKTHTRTVPRLCLNLMNFNQSSVESKLDVFRWIWFWACKIGFRAQYKVHSRFIEKTG